MLDSILKSFKNSDGEFSSKKLTMFISMIMCIVIGLLDQLTEYKLNELVFTSFLGMAGGQAILSTLSTILHFKIASPKVEIDQVSIDKTVHND